MIQRGTSESVVYIREKRLPEKGRVFELHAIKLSIPSCLNLLERLLGIGPFSSRRRRGRRRRRRTPPIQMFSFPPSLLFSFVEPPIQLQSNFIQRSLIQVCVSSFRKLPLFADVKHGDWCTHERIPRILNYFVVVSLYLF